MSKQFPVVEIFGVTIQGEGPDAGRPCVFVRFGGCDYECSWCDSLHAVLPAEVRKAPRLSVQQIINKIVEISMPPMTVVLSGGNPALHDLTELVNKLQGLTYRVTVETQGTKWKPWIADCDMVVVSPKPPSSGMKLDEKVLSDFMENVALSNNVALKVVVGDDKDYEFAKQLRLRHWSRAMFLSVLNPNGSADEFDIQDILNRYKWLCEKVANDPQMYSVKVMPQLHTLAWGNQKGK